MKFDDLNKIYLGGNLCLDKDVSPERMRFLVRKMYDCGLRLIRVYPYWAHIEETKGNYNLCAYDACFEEAEKLDMKIFFTFKPNSPPYWMNLTSSYNLDDYPNLEEPEYFNQFLEYVKHVVNRYKNSPATLAWCVWNEPRMTIPCDCGEYTLFEYRKYLKERYRKIENLNKLYFKQYSSFDEIERIKDFNKSDMPEKTDWLRFSIETLSRIIGKIASAVKKLDPVHPTHINTHNSEFQKPKNAHNMYKESTQVDFPGLSAYPGYTDANSWMCTANMDGFFTAFMRGYAKDKLFWMTELQGGPAIFTYTTSGPSCPEKSDLTLQLWDCIGGGAKACVYWSFTPTVRGEWALLGLLDNNTERCDAIKDAFNLIKKHRNLFDNSTYNSADIYILASESSRIHDHILGKGDDCAQSTSIVATVMLVEQLGYSAQVIDEDAVINGELPDNSVLIAPTCTAIKTETLKKIDKFVFNGGTFIADFLFAWKNDYCMVSNENIEISNKIFGANWIDILDAKDNKLTYFLDGNEGYKVLGARSIFENANNVICTYEDGKISTVFNNYGKGKALRFGSLVFRNAYYPNDKSLRLDKVKDILKNVLPEKRQNGIYLKNANEKFRLQVLNSGESKIIFLLNYSYDKIKAQLLCDNPKKLIDLQSDEIYDFDKIVVAPRSVRLLLYK